MSHSADELNRKLGDTSVPNASQFEHQTILDSERPGVFIKTFGCAMNEYDTEKMRRLLAQEYRSVDSPGQASVVILNTCSVREKAEHKLFSLLGELRELKEERPELIVGVSGCVAQQEGNSIIERAPVVDFVVGTHNLSLVPSLVASAGGGRPKQVAINYREEWEELPEDFDANEASAPKGVDASGTFAPSVVPVRALVAIQRGCNKHCTFCVVPTTRGPEVSRDPEEVLREIRLKVRMGAKEVMLLGQTVNSYGKDLSPRVKFEDLVRRIATIDGLQRIRFISPHPQDVRPSFVELYGSVPQLMPHIHLPLQSGSNRVLKDMNRNYRVERYLEIVELLRARVPGIAITTDIIVGFPSETEEDFEETLSILREVQYDAAFYYKYSPRPNTVALNEFSTVLPDDVLADRFKRLDQLQISINREKSQQRVGKRYPVLVDGVGKRGGLFRGRIPENALVEFEHNGAALGSTLEVVIEEATPFVLKGRVHLEDSGQAQFL